MGSIEIQRLVEGDTYRDWAGHEYKCYQDGNFSFPVEYRVALIGDKKVGWIRFQPCQSETYILDVFVDPNYRGQGIASLLMNEAIKGQPEKYVNGTWMEHRLSSWAKKHNDKVVELKFGQKQTA